MVFTVSLICGGIDDVEIVVLAFLDHPPFAQQIDQLLLDRGAVVGRIVFDHEEMHIGAAGEAALHCFQRHEHDVVGIVAAANRLGAVVDHADDLARDIADPHLFTDHFARSEDFLDDGRADDADAFAARLLFGIEPASLDHVDGLRGEELAVAALHRRLPVLPVVEGDRVRC